MNCVEIFTCHYIGITGVLVIKHFALQWCHNEHDGISNHQHLYCLLNCLSSPGNSPVTGKCFHLMTSSCFVFTSHYIAWSTGYPLSLIIMESVLLYWGHVASRRYSKTSELFGWLDKVSNHHTIWKWKFPGRKYVDFDILIYFFSTLRGCLIIIDSGFALVTTW